MLPLTKAERTALFKSQNQAAATDAAKLAKETQKAEEKLAKKKKEEEKSAKRAARAAGAAQSAVGQDTDGQGTDGRLVKLSRAMSQLLRHRAASEGVAKDCEGYVSWEDMQALKQFRDFTEEDVRRVVETSDKKRFEIKGRADEGLLIRASQGHSRDVAAKIDQHKLLTELQLEQAPAVCIHGTYSRVWPQIQAEGLKCMGRQHIHLTDSLSKPEGQQKVSGFRADCDVLIYVDAARAMSEGLVFFRSSNGVILTEGSSGVVPPHLFVKATNPQGQELLLKPEL